jgi:hypothetical protein
MIAATILAVALNSTIVASKDSRCNDIDINAIQGRMQNFAQHPAAPKDQAERGEAIAQAQNDVQTERVILAGVCSGDDLASFIARLDALDGWADLLAERNNDNGGSSSLCPTADKKVMAAAAASAWTKLAAAASVAKEPPPLVATLTPQVQALATQAGLTLPAFRDTTQYWEQQYATAAKAAVVDCASQQTPTPIPRK